MPPKVIVVIDTERGFIERFTEKLAVNELDEDYRIEPVTPNTKVDLSQRIVECKEKIQDLINNEDVAGIFIDIVVVETGSEDDTSGIDIAVELKKSYPTIPIFNITSKYRNPSETDGISRASLENIDGVLIKSYLDGKTFSESRLKKIFRKAKEKWHTQNGNEIILKIPDGIHESINVSDPRVKTQIDEIGANIFWTLVSKLKPGATGTISYLRPGRSGAYVFRWFASTKVDGYSKTLPKSWVLKIADNPDLLEHELQNYIALKDTPLYRVFYPQVSSDEVIRVGKYGAILIELEEGAQTLKEYLPTIADENDLDVILKGIERFFHSTYGDQDRTPFFVWNKFYSLNDSLINNILAEMRDFEDIFKTLFDSQEYDGVYSFVKKEGPIFDKINLFEQNVDQRTIHGDFNAGNILINPNNQIVVIDFSSRVQSHVAKDVAKLERDIIFRVYDRNLIHNYDWSRVKHWSNFLELHSATNFFDNVFKEMKDLQLTRSLKFIKGIRNTLKVISPNLTEREYLCALLHYNLIAIVHPEFSFQKKIFAVRSSFNILNQF